MTRAAFQATYSDWRLIKTRKVVQIVFEVPVEQAGLAYDVLGGMPNFGSEVWCAIARLKQQPKENEAQPRPSTLPTDEAATGGAQSKKSWHELSPTQQSGILCAEPAFWKFVEEFIGGYVQSEDDCIRAIRSYCRVQSRKQITAGSDAAKRWQTCVWDYRTWMQEPAVVPQ